MRLKELTTSCTDLTAERNKLSSLVKEYKGELIRFEEMKLEYEDYKREMSQKVSQLERAELDIERIKAENEELTLRNERMQKRLAEKQQVILINKEEEDKESDLDGYDDDNF